MTHLLYITSYAASTFIKMALLIFLIQGNKINRSFSNSDQFIDASKIYCIFVEALYVRSPFSAVQNVNLNCVFPNVSRSLPPAFVCRYQELIWNFSNSNRAPRYFTLLATLTFFSRSRSLTFLLRARLFFFIILSDECQKYLLRSINTVSNHFGYAIERFMAIA